MTTSMTHALMSGHLRIDNTLAEAIISGPFSGAQVKIALAVFRLTVGWQRQTVRLTLEQLAQRCGYDEATGGFREQRKKLLDAGVLEFAPEGAGRGAAGAYRLQTDPSRWGMYAPTAEMQKLWKVRPEHADDQLPLRIMTVEQSGEKVPENRQATDESMPVNGQASCLITGKEAAYKEAGKVNASDAAAASSGAGKQLKAMKSKPQVGIGEALQLLERLEALQENVGGQNNRVTIRHERIKATLGDDVDAAVRMFGGIDRILNTKPEYRGVLARDFAAVLTRVREEAA